MRFTRLLAHIATIVRNTALHECPDWRGDIYAHHPLPIPSSNTPSICLPPSPCSQDPPGRFNRNDLKQNPNPAQLPSNFGLAQPFLHEFGRSSRLSHGALPGGCDDPFIAALTMRSPQRLTRQARAERQWLNGAAKVAWVLERRASRRVHGPSRVVFGFSAPVELSRKVKP